MSSDDILNLAPPKADARVSYGSDQNQFLDLRIPKTKESHPLAICIHGGFWRAKYDLEYLGHICAALTCEGHGDGQFGIPARGECRAEDGREPLPIFARRISCSCRRASSTASMRSG